MSANDQKPPVPTGEPAGQYFPPPPPGPPPGQVPHQPPKHPNDTPIPDYNIPGYDPKHPHFAPPPKVPEDDDGDLYGATPTDEHPPPFPPRPTSSEHHGDGEGGTKASWSHRLSGWGTKAAAPFNALANKMGSETFLPTTMDKECEKAARILRSFCKDGIYSDTPAPAVNPSAPSDKQPETSPKGKKPRVLLTIPSKVIARAQGLAIFTTARAGFQVSGATGSGILIARKPNGAWSPPSGIQVHSVGAGFVIGLDIYDCVVVINTREALDAFTKTRMSLGSDLAVTAGPWGAGGALDWGIPQPAPKGKDKTTADATAPANPIAPVDIQQQPQVTPGVSTGPTAPVSAPGTAPEDPAAAGEAIKRKPSPFQKAISNPVYSYVKSRGFYAGVQIDGTVVTERKEANAAFYGAPITVTQIIKGEIPSQGPSGMWPTGAKVLFEVLKGAEGWRSQGQPNHLLATPGVPAAGGFSGVGGAAAPAAPAPTAPCVPAWSHESTAPGPSAFGGGPAPPPPGAPTVSAADAKAAEAAAEASRAAHAEPDGAPPPSYTEPTGVDDLPPAYVENGQYRPPGGSGDSKTGLH